MKIRKNLYTLQIFTNNIDQHHDLSQNVIKCPAISTAVTVRTAVSCASMIRRAKSSKTTRSP